MKFQKGFVEEYEKQLQEEEVQRTLRDKYNIEDDKTVNIVKLSSWQFFIEIVSSWGRKLLTVVMLIFFAIGVLAMLYPKPRTEMLFLFQEILDEITAYLPDFLVFWN
ncbi:MULTISPECIES: hypothetical protein [unclassified Emergencia]|uniref:hypothetical protein n=1 Tax=unclassified Emergencia TaxID=2642996 RepID=UPI001379B27C|nr:hypothetical protein [Emergencia sp. 1XD21-10]MCI9640140.1 hypothetical protein [Emergencia sp.]NCE98829.1 hypothetical protein [Emergencia sp. 1XD21-10]